MLTLCLIFIWVGVEAVVEHYWTWLHFDWMHKLQGIDLNFKSEDILDHWQQVKIDHDPDRDEPGKGEVCMRDIVFCKGKMRIQ